MRQLVFKAVAETDDVRDFSTLAQFEQIARVSTLEALANEIGKVTRSVGAAHYLYRTRVPMPDGDTIQFVFSSDPEVWHQRYDENASAAIDIDPVVEHCLERRSRLPRVWPDGSLDASARRELWDDAREHGLASGLTVPIQGAHGESASFSVANPEQGEDGWQHQVHVAGTLYLTAAYIHAAIRRLVYRPEQSRVAPPGLSHRELECLRWWVSGKSGWDIAHLMGISERTVRHHIDSIKKKLGAQSKTDVITKALRLNLGSRSLVDQ